MGVLAGACLGAPAFFQSVAWGDSVAESRVLGVANLMTLFVCQRFRKPRVRCPISTTNSVCRLHRFRQAIAEVSKCLPKTGRPVICRSSVWQTPNLYVVFHLQSVRRTHVGCAWLRKASEMRRNLLLRSKQGIPEAFCLCT